MTIAGLSIPDLVGLVFGFLFTIMIFSYLIGDNLFFRLALYIFIGAASGFALVVVAYNVLWYQMLLPLIQNPIGSLYMVVPALLLGLWLLTKLSTRMASIGNPVMGYLVGVGAATIIGGAVLGTLFPQIGASASQFDPEVAAASGLPAYIHFIRGLIILAGTALTLLYFHFGVRQTPDGQVRRPRWIEELSGIGQIFIAITFGVLFAGVYSAALAALVERMRFLLDSVVRFLPSG